MELEFDKVVKTVKQDHPNDGEVLLKGHLSRLGIKDRRSQLRARLIMKERLIDVLIQLNSHLLVVHAGVDGFSRTIVYIMCANNNKATTVLEAFVWRYMLKVRGENESCVRTGSSTHNERIERMWRDVYRCVSSQFAVTFHGLESSGVLYPLNEVDIFCLHFTFLPRINKLPSEFQESWNNHGLSTEGQCTPYQLFTEGFLFEDTTARLSHTHMHVVVLS